MQKSRYGRYHVINAKLLVYDATSRVRRLTPQWHPQSRQSLVKLYMKKKIIIITGLDKYIGAVVVIIKPTFSLRKCSNGTLSNPEVFKTHFNVLCRRRREYRPVRVIARFVHGRRSRETKKNNSRVLFLSDFTDETRAIKQINA